MERAEPVSNSHLPAMAKVGNTMVPAPPPTPHGTGVEPALLSDLALKLCNTVPRLTSDWAAEQLCLAPSVIERLFWQLRDEQLVEILGQDGPLSYRYAITQRGREFARRLTEISGYVGPAPVSLESYAAMLEWQIARHPEVTEERVRQAVSPLVLPREAIEVAALSASSGRSLFLFGPPGNGKTSLGRLMHNVLEGDLWVPHCIAVENNIIRIYDAQLHQASPVPGGEGRVDRRWMRIRRPMIIAGGEMTIAELDLAYSPSLRFYEAPPHVKANGGLFFLDDFGRQRIDPTDLLNRWIIPLEHQIDYLTLVTGQKIRIPFRLQLIVATNLMATKASDPAFLRRIGYRMHMERPDAQRYTEIFNRYAASCGLRVDPTLVSEVLERYRHEQRELRASEPRDLIERCRDICTLRRQPARIDGDVLDLAWVGYFGTGSADPANDGV
jgi:predicted ATPase with chaperone activity